MFDYINTVKNIDIIKMNYILVKQTFWVEK